MHNIAVTKRKKNVVLIVTELQPMKHRQSIY